MRDAAFTKQAHIYLTVIIDQMRGNLAAMLTQSAIGMER
jgi:hypothetical protein